MRFSVRGEDVAEGMTVAARWHSAAVETTRGFLSSGDQGPRPTGRAHAGSRAAGRRVRLFDELVLRHRLIDYGANHGHARGDFDQIKAPVKGF